MRIKKKQIMEMVAQNNTSNTSNTNQPTNNPQLPNKDEIAKTKQAVEDLNSEIANSELSAFMSISENNPGDMSTFAADAIDAAADRDEQNKRDYDEWLQSPEGQEYIKNMDSINESISGRKIIKTIKVKDLK